MLQKALKQFFTKLFLKCVLKHVFTKNLTKKPKVLHKLLNCYNLSGFKPF